MNREYHSGFSQILHRQMEMLVFGHGGVPVIVFPTSMAPFFEWEDRGMIAAVAHKCESGEFQFFCIQSVDAESWYNRHIHPRHRIVRHVQFDHFVAHEIIPYIRSRNPNPALVVTGASFGGYHAVNFALRHPDLVTGCVSLGGAFDVQSFLDGYYDDDCYFNSPPHFLPNLTDEWYLDRYRSLKLVLATGDWDHCLDQNLRLSRMLEGKGVPHWLDVWGDHTGHDWPWWQRMVQKYFA